MVGGGSFYSQLFYFHFQLLTSQMESNLFESGEEEEKKKELEIKKNIKGLSTKTLIVIGWLEGGCENCRGNYRRNVDRPLPFPNTHSSELCFSSTFL
ncbi:hypothetical protein CEXT_791731 [Caerostris extrusa]|uniref:Uncharacterized protein n=1 Tax=Caerostris extrusa TaxID=172846 RepID=A0AAV4V835_CAEEX|nr:hypothetical protein CEXT_791731 [Caerostris extrusa]